MLTGEIGDQSMNIPFVGFDTVKVINRGHMDIHHISNSWDTLLDEYNSHR